MNLLHPQFVEIPAPDDCLAVSIDRDARFPQFVGADSHAAERVRQVSLAVIGVGSVGATLAIDLSRCGLRKICLIDPGTFDPENLLTQPIFPENVGQPKAIAIGRQVKRLNPFTHVSALQGRVEVVDPADMIDLDLAVLATDNLSAEVAAGQLCRNLGIPLVQASVDGPTLVTQIRFFTNTDARSACPACGFGKAEWAALNAEKIYRCGGPDGVREHRTAVPTMSVRPLCALAAEFAALRVLRHVLGLGQPSEDELFEFRGYPGRCVTTKLQRREDCPCDHRVWQRVMTGAPIGSVKVGELVELAGVKPERPGVTMSAGRRAFVTRGLCSSCRTAHQVQRFLLPGETTLCTHCGGVVHREPFHTFRPVPVAQLNGVCDRMLSDIADADVRSIVIEHGESSSLIVQ